MDMKRYLGLILCLLLAAGLCFAMAEEENLFSAHVELFTEGAFPNDPPMLISTFGLDDFNGYMLGKLRAQESEIDVSAFELDKETFYSMYQMLLNANPDMFYVSGAYQYYANASHVTRILPDYLYEGSELERMKNVYASGVNAIVSYARKSGTVVGQLLRANDYMVANYEYDETFSIYSPEKFFEKGRGVCQAYMLTYRAVLNKLGITNISVSSSVMNHTWNMVYLEGNWYHIDVTWNDPISDVPLRAVHEHFLLSDAGITASGHYSWDDSQELVFEASDTRYDHYFWKKINQPISMQGDVVYYVDSDYETTLRHVYSFHLRTGSVQKLYTYDYGYYPYYTDYNAVWVENQTIYYALRDAFYAVALSGGEAQIVYSTGNSSQWIWFPFRSGSYLKLYVAPSPSKGGSIHTYLLTGNVQLTVNPEAVMMRIGDEAQLSYVLTPEDFSGQPLTWESENNEVATVSQNGLVRAAGPGVTRITAQFNANIKDVCTVVVRAEDAVYLPADTVSVGEMAFAKINAAEIVLPEGIQTIGSKAFSDNEHLLIVNLPSTLISIANDAFEGCRQVTLVCTAGSKGEAFAVETGMNYVCFP